MDIAQLFSPLFCTIPGNPQLLNLPNLLQHNPLPKHQVLRICHKQNPHDRSPTIKRDSYRQQCGGC